MGEKGFKRDHREAKSGRVFFRSKSLEKEGKKGKRRRKEIHGRSMRMINVGTRFEDAWAERIEAGKRGDAARRPAACDVASARLDSASRWLIDASP